ncbi:MAG: 50S ribosomal protein L23 [Patescibacteria group bacterium]|jgi:large subunit ribosomal protein L23
MGIMDKLTKSKKSTDKETKDESEVTVVAPAKMKSASSSAMKIIIKPMVTEKAATHQTTHRAYSFIVARSANKIEIAKAVKELYGVEPMSVRTANIEGHVVRFSKGFGRKSDYKKAMVTLKKGDSITIHEGV